jgi:hypothetical protein
MASVKCNEGFRCKGKCKVHPRTGYEGPEGIRGVALVFL